MRLPLLDADDQTSIDLPQVCKMADTFLERGFTYFDTAYMYSASTCKILTNTGGFSSGRISGCAGNSGLSGVPPLARPMTTCGGPAPPEANPQDLRPLAHFDTPQGGG
jgi:hypothetical protein